MGSLAASNKWLEHAHVTFQNPVTGVDGYETFELDQPFWQAIDAAFRKYILTANTTDPRTLYYYNQVGILTAHDLNAWYGWSKGKQLIGIGKAAMCRPPQWAWQRARSLS